MAAREGEREKRVPERIDKKCSKNMISKRSFFFPSEIEAKERAEGSSQFVVFLSLSLPLAPFLSRFRFFSVSARSGPS